MPRPKGKRPIVRLSVGLPPHHHAVLMRLAEQQDQSIAGMVRKAIAEFVERHESSEQVELPLHSARSGVAR